MLADLGAKDELDEFYLKTEEGNYELGSEEGG
jgi:hypothetical protein